MRKVNSGTRQLILKMAMTLDGFVCGPNSELDWLFKYGSDRGKEWTIENLWQAGAHLMGRSTFCDMADYWPTSQAPFAPPMNEIPKVVFSKNGTFDPATLNLTAADSASTKSWREARVLTGDLSEHILALKKEPGKPLLAHGGATFAQNLVATGLIDEYRLALIPVALGQGMPLFSRLDEELGLELIEALNLDGPVALVYRPRR